MHRQRITGEFQNDRIATHSLETAAMIISMNNQSITTKSPEEVASMISSVSPNELYDIIVSANARELVNVISIVDTLQQKLIMFNAILFCFSIKHEMDESHYTAFLAYSEISNFKRRLDHSWSEDVKYILDEVKQKYGLVQSVDNTKWIEFLILLYDSNIDLYNKLKEIYEANKSNSNGCLGIVLILIICASIIIL